MDYSFVDNTISEYMQKIMSNKFSEKELTKDYLLSAVEDAENLYNGDVEETLEDHYNDFDLDEIKDMTETPIIYVYKKNAPVKIDSDDIFRYLENEVSDQEADSFDYKKVDELLKPLNEYLDSISCTYTIVGVIKEEEVKPIWEKLRNEWLEGEE